MSQTLYRRVQIDREAARRFRLVPIARNGRRLPHAKTYVSERNARRAVASFYGDSIEVVLVDKRKPA